MSQPSSKSSKWMSLVYLVIYFLGICYNVYRGNTLFIGIWSALFLGNLAYLIYMFVKKK